MSIQPATFKKWEARVITEQYGVLLDITTYTVTAEFDGTGYSATINGRPAELRDAFVLVTTAEKQGGLTLLEEVRPDTIGKKAAHVMHQELAHLRFADHYAVAADALGRPVSSLAALTAAEANLVYSYAYGQWGMV